VAGTDAIDRDRADQLFELVYDELRALAEQLMRSERRDHTLEATAVVNEAYLRLIEQKRLEWRGRRQFFALAAHLIRRILIEHARRRSAAKRGGGLRRWRLADDLPADGGQHDADLLDLDRALSRLSALSERQSCIVELRFFAGLSVDDVARVLGLCPSTVKGEWRVARAWLHGYLNA
jgi:RNA polymerase sigma factor (TIGR02999 family)